MGRQPLEGKRTSREVEARKTPRKFPRRRFKLLAFNFSLSTRSNLSEINKKANFASAKLNIDFARLVVKTQNGRIGGDSGLCRCREHRLSSITNCPHFLPENTSHTPSQTTSCVTRYCACCPAVLFARKNPQSSALLGQGRSLHRLRFTPKMGTNPPVPVNPHHSSSSPPSAFFASVSPLARSPTARLLRYPNLSSQL